MSRIPLVSTDPESPVLRERFAEIQSWGFQLPNAVRMFANHETFFGAFVEMIRALLRGGQALPPPPRACVSPRFADQRLSLLNTDPRDARSERRVVGRRDGGDG